MEMGDDNALTIEVTTKCNLRCKNCFALADLPRKLDMDYEIAKSIVREGREVGYQVLHLTGGEPTLWPYFFDLIYYSLQIGYRKIQFNTNGIPLSEEFCNRLKEYREMVDMSISINGTKELHEEVRRHGTYQRAIKGLENALKYQLNIEIFTTIGKSLLNELPNYANMLFTDYPNIQGLTLIQFHRVENDFYDVKEELLTPRDFVKLVKQISLLNLYGYRISFLYNPYAFLVGKILKLPCIPKSKERISTTNLVVLNNLKITGNHSSRKEYKNYQEGVLKEIIESTSIKNSEVCMKCKFSSFCQENEIYNPAPEDLDFESTPFCQRLLNMLI
ncbi:MAG: radical SAM protein [Leptospiraceae bacterium]|nr:radical SAM protein [Leptospiraceae bacterium]MCP5498100.1 radical SAM protein [Leptospiraceae bacterium]